MRWYCVHPSLPPQAELRIRAAPDSRAAERGRISQGRAIAACSPVFHVPGDDAGSVSWLQVAYLDAASGETEGGFMMAVLPDGMELVTPWEETRFSCCCEVRDSAALLYNGPHETAQSLGAVPSLNFLYCVVEEGESRVRILHPDLESVWVDKNDLQIVCARLKHQDCSTPHTFYELNEALPEEAQISIREFPSKEAQTVGLLSQGETLEVTVRGGNWLQVAGSSVDKAWIMWRTDALELLQEAADVCSSTCIAKNIGDAVNSSAEEDQVGAVDNQTEVDAAVVSVIGDEVEGAPVMADESAAVVSATEVAGAAVPSLVTDEYAIVAATIDEAEKSESIEKSRAWEGRSIWSAQAAHEPGGEDTFIDCIDANASSVKSWDDRPIRPAPIVSEETDLGEEGGTSSARGAINDTTSAVDDDMANQKIPLPSDDHLAKSAQLLIDTTSACSIAALNMQAIAQGTAGTGLVQATPPWDDRPIRPAQTTPEEVKDDSTAVHVDAVLEIDDIAALNDGGGGDNDTGEPTANADEAEEAEPVRAVLACDDRPIRPAPVAFDASGDVENYQAIKDGELLDTGLVQATPSWDDRPIRPAQTAPEEVKDDSTAVHVDAVLEIDDIAALNDGGGGDNDTGEPTANADEAEEAEPVRAVLACDDRPIRPAPVAFDASGDVENYQAIKDGELLDTGLVQATPSWDDRPIRPAQTAPEEVKDDSTAVHVDAVLEIDDIAALNDGGGGDNDTGEPTANADEAEEAEPVRAVLACDDRPIRPAPVAFDASGDVENYQAIKDGELLDTGLVQATPSWDDRPIRPAQTAPEEVKDDSTAVHVDAVLEIDDIAALNDGGGGDNDTGEPTANADEAEEAEPVRAVLACDDRPIRPAPVAFDASGDVENYQAIKDGELLDTGLVQATPSWDDRPIRPAQTAPEEVKDDSTAVHVDAVLEIDDIAALNDGGGGDNDTGEPTANADEAEEAEPVRAVLACDDRPIRPAPVAFDASGDVENYQAIKDGELLDTGLVQATPSWDDRPIRPAQTAPEEVKDDSTAVHVDAVLEIDDIAALNDGGGGDNDTGEPTANADEAEEAEPVRAVLACDDRPIRPAPVAFDASGDVENYQAIKDGELLDTGLVQATPSWDDRPIRPAQTAPEEVKDDSTAVHVDAVLEIDDIAALNDGGGGDNDTGEPTANADEAEEAEPVRAVLACDDRPIRPAPVAFDASGDVENYQAIKDGELLDTGLVQATPSWDDRPIRPAQTAPEEVKDDSTAVHVDAVLEIDDIAALNDGGGGDNDTGEPTANADEAEEAEPVRAVLACDDRPIRPAPVAFDASGDVENYQAIKDGELLDTGLVQATPSWDDRPIRPAQTAPEEVKDDSTAVHVDAVLEIDDIAALNDGGGGDNDTGEPTANADEAEEAEPVRAVLACDDRPIRPAPVAFDASGDVENYQAIKDGESLDTGLVQATWDDRVIKPDHTLPIDGSDGGRICGEDALDKRVQSANDCSSVCPQCRTADNCSVLLDASSVDNGFPRTLHVDRHYPNPMNRLGAFERRYAESETASGSESGEIALLGSLEDVFDPVDELLPAMPEEDANEMDNGSSGLLSTAVGENIPAGGADVLRSEWTGGDGDLHDTNPGQDKAHGGNSSPTDGISFLQHVGIGKYCEHKQSLSAPSDALSQAMYEADQDDSDLVFEALVGDAPLSDDWFHDVASRNRLPESHSHIPSMSATRSPGHPRASSSSGPKDTYELIMNDALPEEIFASELLDEKDGDYDLIGSFRYPLPKRRGLGRIGSRTSVLGSQPLTPPSGRAKTSPVAAAPSVTPPKIPSSALFARTPAKPEPSNSRLARHQSVAALSSVKKPLGSLPRPRSFVSAMPVPGSASAQPGRSGLPKPAVPSDTPPSQPPRSLLQRRSFIAAPTPTKGVTIGSTPTTSSVPKRVEPSGLQMPRKSFGFRPTSKK